jgi:hypothetical protein
MEKLRRHRDKVSAWLQQETTARSFAPSLTLNPAQEQLDRIRQALTDLNDDRINIDGTVKFLSTQDGPKTVDLHITSLERMADQIDTAARRNRAAANGGLLAMVLAAFNSAFEAGISTDNDLDAYIEAETARSEARSGDLWEVLRADNPSGIWAAAQNMREAAGNLLLRTTVPAVAACARARQDDPADAAAGRQAMAAANLLRAQLFEIALAAAVLWDNGWNLPQRRRRWIKAAQKASRRKAGYRWPRETTISWLSGTGRNRADGSERTVAGRVTAIHIQHTGGKAVSKVTLSSGSHQLTAVLPHIKIDSGGLSVDSWCRMAGTWRADSTETDGAALHVDRRSLSALSAKGWPEAALGELLGEFTPIPHALNLEFSWQPGLDGAAKQLVYESWYRHRSL